MSLQREKSDRGQDRTEGVVRQKVLNCCSHWLRLNPQLPRSLIGE